MKTLAAHSPAVKYLLVASEDDFNPIPAMLGFSREVFKFLDNLVTTTLALEGDGQVREYVGGYTDWLA